MAILCVIHHAYCTKFFDHHQVKGKIFAKENGRRDLVVSTGQIDVEMPEKAEVDKAWIKDAHLSSNMTCSSSQISEDSPEKWNDHHQVIDKIFAKENGRRDLVVSTGQIDVEMSEKAEVDKAWIKDAHLSSNMTSSSSQISEDSPEKWNEEKMQKREVMDVAEM